MNCRGCGRRIPESYLKLDCFECPHCGRRYRRTAAPAGKPAPAQRRPVPGQRQFASSARSAVNDRTYRRPGQRRQGSARDKIKAVLTQRVWKLPVYLLLILIVLVIILFSVIVHNATDNTKEAGEALKAWTSNVTSFNEDVARANAQRATAEPVATQPSAVQNATQVPSGYFSFDDSSNTSSGSSTLPRIICKGVGN